MNVTASQRTILAKLVDGWEFGVMRKQHGTLPFIEQGGVGSWGRIEKVHPLLADALVQKGLIEIGELNWPVQLYKITELGRTFLR